MIKGRRPLWSKILLLLMALQGGACSSDSTITTAPPSVSGARVDLVAYNSMAAHIRVSGTMSVPGLTDFNLVSLYNNDSCSGEELGEATHALFASTGIEVQISSLQPTSIYLATNTVPGCTFVGQFSPDYPAPVQPTFLYTSPMSPSRNVSRPLVFGMVVGLADRVEIFDDASCSHLVGSGTASDFASTGIFATLQENQESSLYARSIEPFGKLSDCTFLANYKHTTVGPNPPALLAVSPVTPAKDSTHVTLQFAGPSEAVRATVFSDAACSSQLSQVEGSAPYVAEFDVQANATTKIYAQVYDEFGFPSLCAYLLNFTHDNAAPLSPTFDSVSPVSPTRLTVFPRFKGYAPSDAAVIQIFNSPACLMPSGFGSKTEFEGAGILAGVQPNTISSMWARSVDAAGNPSECIYLLDYKHNTIPPDPPVFGTSVPLSPTNQSTQPILLGTPSLNTVEVLFYQDDSCLTLIGQGSAETFEQTGIMVNVLSNALTDIFARSRDLEGNLGICTSMTTFDHSTAPAPDPSFVRTTPASPARTTNKPYVVGSAAAKIASVSLFSDNLCQNILGTGTRASFVNIGVQVTLIANAITPVYAQATDVYGNFSSCVHMLNYTHDDIAPFAPDNPLANPLSPNRLSHDPIVSGGLLTNPAKILPVTEVSLYDSFLCLNRVGFGTPTEWTNGFIADLPANTITTLYGKSVDFAGNQSPCTYLQEYTHSDLPPGIPVFGGATPATPSYVRQTVIMGAIASSSSFLAVDEVNLYSESTCTTPLAASIPATFLGGGIAITVNDNATTPVYGRTVDIVGNLSNCALLVNFVHYDVGPSNLMSTLLPNGAVQLNWLPDTIARPTPTYTVKRAIRSGGPYTVIAENLLSPLYVDTQVSHNATYYYVVSAANSTGSSKNSTETSLTIVPSPAAVAGGLSASPGPGAVYLNWSGLNTNMTYKVFRAQQTGGPYALIASDLTSGTYNDTGLVNGTPYYYVVKGNNPAGDSEQTNEVAATPLPPPAEPMNLTIMPSVSLPQCGGGAGVAINWSAPSYYNNFSVFRSQNPGGGNILTTTTNTWAYDCSPDYTWNYYSVVASWGTGYSSISNEVVFYDAGIPSFSAFPGDSEVLLRWASSAAIDFSILRSQQSGGPYSVVDSANAGISFTDSTVSNGTAYFYVLHPNIGPGVVTWPSQEVRGVPGPLPTAPSQLSLTISVGRPYLNWAPGSRFNVFNVYRASAIGGPYVLLGSTTGTTWTDFVPAVGMNYYRITALWGNHESASTNTVEFRNGAPTGLTATAGSLAIGLSWTTVPSSSSYSVFRSATAGALGVEVATPATPLFSDTTVVAGEGYFYKVRANFADATVSLFSSEVSGMLTGATVPAGVSVTATASNSVGLAWASVRNATSYRVYQSTSVGGPFAFAGSTAQTSFNVFGLLQNAEYFYRVTAVIGTEGSPSNVVSAFTYGAPTSPNAVAGHNQVSLFWSPPLGALSYDVLRSTDALNYSAIATGLAVTSHTDLTASNGITYYYKVAANFPSTQLSSTATLAVVPGLVPQVPSGLTIVDNSSGTDVTLNFAGVSLAASYRIYWGTSTGVYGSSQVTTGATNNLISGLSPGTQYFLVVSSLNGSNESAQSAEITFVAASSPPAPQVWALTATSVSVSWSAVAGATNYNVYRSIDGVIFSEVATNVAALTWTDNAAISGQWYRYRYLPRAGTVAMAMSLTSSPVVPGIAPPSPAALVAEAVSNTQARLQWVSSPQSAAYSLFRATASGGPYTLVSGVATSPYLDTGAADATYFYVVLSVNASGVASAASNEVAVHLGSPPTGLAALVADTEVQLSWNVVAGASSYVVRRGLTTGGPYGIVAQPAANSFDDEEIEHGTTYFYVVNAVFGDGSVSQHSNEIQVTASKVMDLEVPIELIDQAVSSNTVPLVFETSRTTLDTDYYDGTLSYRFEVNALNYDGVDRTISLVSGSGGVVGSVVVPANTTSLTRIEAGFAANNGLDTYRVSTPATALVDSVQILAARIIVRQQGASRTRIYIPLLASQAQPTHLDHALPIAQTAQTTWVVLDQSSIYRRDTSVLQGLAEYNAWELEAIVSSSSGALGQISLMNRTTGVSVPGTQGEFSSSTAQMVSAPFDEGTSQFAAAHEGNEYEIVLRCVRDCQSGQAFLHKAGLWVNLPTLRGVEVPFRQGVGLQIMGGETRHSTRSRIDLSRFSNPSVSFEVVGRTLGLDGLSVQLMTAGVSEFLVSGLTPIVGTDFSLVSNQKSRTKVGPIVLVSDDRFLLEAQLPGSDTAVVNSSVIWIRTSH